MKRIFVLRNRKGDAIGYIQQIGDMVHIGLSSEGEVFADNLFLQFRNGRMYCKKLEAGTKEEKWRDENEIIGGYLVYRSEVIADTGGFVKKEAVFNLHEPFKTFKPKQSEAHKKSDERRMVSKWPPNPCDPGNALYRAFTI